MDKRVIVEVQAGSPVRNQSGTSGKTGKQYSINKQEAWLHVGNPYPERIAITLEANATPYAPGLYEIDYQKSIIVNQYGEPRFGRLHLVPARKAESVAPARAS